ncbi:hypothetical protein CCACVL1_04218 [Corchorus capsularis]|uniref:Uncharacterized protein n=1 Tax=Corchorus capsularis TaxID=210143 RepID=A0A1R3JUD1_COCAP|nr:hypothetical protein CCACVL1_04218 [Corchorus capsularis]
MVYLKVHYVAKASLSQKMARPIMIIKASQGIMPPVI